MAKRGLSGVKEAHNRNRFSSIEHPWSSHLWETPEAIELMDTPGIFTTCFSMCCFGGRRVKWTCLVHNIPSIHEALDKWDCPGHPNLLPYEVPEGLEFDTSEEAQYPMRLCIAYAQALKRQVIRQTPVPINDMPFDEDSALLGALRTSTRGFQDPAAAELALQKIVEVLATMEDGEKHHLKWLLRQVALRGCDVKLLSANEDGSQSVMSPYPAFRWNWSTRLSFPWKHEQHINVLEVSAFLVEFRRRTRQTQGLGIRFFNITDSQVMFHVLTKGRSSSPRLNRLLRRTNALILFSGTQPVHLWTISKRNFADAPSRRVHHRRK